MKIQTPSSFGSLRRSGVSGLCVLEGLGVAGGGGAFIQLCIQGLTEAQETTRPHRTGAPQDIGALLGAPSAKAMTSDSIKSREFQDV